MDLKDLSQQVTTFLIPFLPYLVKGGEKLAEEIGEKLGSTAWKEAGSLWNKLRPVVAKKPAAQEAVQGLIDLPEDVDRQDAFRMQLQNLLKDEKDLANEISQTLSRSHFYSNVIVENVLQNGEVIGFEAQEVDSDAGIESRLRAKNVRGKVVGISVNKIGK